MKHLILAALVSAAFINHSLAQESTVKYGRYYREFREGHYYTLDGKKVTGLIKFNFAPNALNDNAKGDCSITFKDGPDGKKKNFKAHEISGFVIEIDSFTVIKNFRFDQYVKYGKDFVRVIEGGEKLGLYVYYSIWALNGAEVRVEVLATAEKAHAVWQDDFKKIVEKYVGDEPELMEKINNGELWDDHLQEIVKLYNAHKAGK